MENNQNKRVESVDVLRGITILVMLFVNDIAGVVGTPAWMKHMPPGTDGMTFVDVVFPAFLFIVGMSIPLSIGRRLRNGYSIWQVWKRILVRTFSLLVIGIFMVNTHTASENGILGRHLWTLIMYAGVILTWNTPPSEPGKRRTLILRLRIVGIFVLVVSALLYNGEGVVGFFQLRPQWWGILGLIGWAYLIASLIYIPLRRNMTGLLGMVGILFCVFMADEAGFFNSLHFTIHWVKISYTWGSHPAIILLGVILGIILTPDSPIGETHRIRIKWAFLYGLGLALAAVLLHSLHNIHKMFIIDKNMGTPPWSLWSSAITIWVWIILYWMLDVKGWKKLTTIVKPAGANALFAYILAPIFYEIFWVLARIFGGFDFFSQLGRNFTIGFFRAFIFAFVMTWITGALRKTGVWLKL